MHLMGLNVRFSTYGIRQFLSGGLNFALVSEAVKAALFSGLIFR